MGTNASVLQWPCFNCQQLNPSDRQNCIKCNTKRIESEALKRENKSGMNLKRFWDSIPQSAAKMKTTKDDSAWRCENCTRLNSLSVKTCESCFQEMTPDPVILESYNINGCDSQTWLCHNCQDSNSIKTEVCGRCNTVRKTSTGENSKSNKEDENTVGDMGLPGKTQHTTWTCGNCYFSMNSSEETKCEICGTPDASRQKKERVEFSFDKISMENSVATNNSEKKQKLDNNKISIENSVATNDSEKKQKLDNETQNIQKPDDCLMPSVSLNLNSTGLMWKCPECSSNNKPGAQFCHVCKRQPTPLFSLEEISGTKDKISDTMDDSLKWSCRRCTFLNRNTAHICYMCNTKKEIQLPTEADIASKISQEKTISQNNGLDDDSITAMLKFPVQESWACRKCTLINDESAVRCSACGADKLEVTKENKPHKTRNPAQVFQRQKTMCMEDIRQLGEESGRAHWTAVVKRCQEAGVQFIDDAFPPCEKSLFYSSVNSKGKNIVWKRPKDIQGNSHGERSVPWTVFRTPFPTDIVQGILGNCWFLSALAVLTERPEVIQKILINKEICPEGVYELRLCVDGKWQNVVIDDLLPCDSNGRLVYSQARRKQLWVPLIEKALAKVYKCYEALTAGRCIEGLACLTGAPCESLSLHGENVDKDMIWAQLLSARESHFLMGAACGAGAMKVDEAEWNRKGLRARHAYSVLDVQNISGHRLLRLRNPWGTHSWNGPWSDGSKEWTTVSREVAEQHTPHGADEGVFWMALDDFMKYFDGLDMCKYRPEWMEFRSSGIIPAGSDEPGIAVFELEVFEHSEVDFGLFQENLRASKRNQRNLIDLCLVVVKKESGDKLGHVVCSSRRQIRSFVGCSTVLNTGSYFVVCFGFSHWALDSAKGVNFAMSLHSAKVMQVDRVMFQTTVLADVMIQLALKDGSRQEGREGMTIYYLNHGVGFIIMIENKRADRSLHVKCDCDNSFNIVSTRKSLKSADVIPPLHRQVVLVLTQLEPSEGYSISHRLLHRPAAINSSLEDWGHGHHDPPLSNDIYGLHVPRPL